MKTHKLNRYVVKFYGRAYVRGEITVQAKSIHEAMAVAFADMKDGGIVWEYEEYDEEYDPRIREVDELCFHRRRST